MKYMGSKARLAKEISPIINKLILENNIDDYIEPFVGGANMIQHIKCKNKIGSDSNEYLISMWNSFKKGYIPPEYISKELYLDIKNNKNKYDKQLVAIAGFCSTYNAKWFGGYAGIVSTKTGKKRNYYDEAIRNISKQISQLKDVEFLNYDYSYFSEYENALIYCDPPYQGTTKYGVSDEFHYDRFWQWVREMSKKNIVLVSEYNAPDDFKYIYKKTLTTTLDKSSRKKTLKKYLYIVL